MTHEFDPGYGDEPWRSLVAEYPDAAIYPTDSFRVEWGPVFHRGRLDGSARVLVIGQDPSTHETITRRILIGEAGQRVQGFLDKLGIDRSYVMVNTFLYSVYGQWGGDQHKDDPGIVAYRNRWLDALLVGTDVEVVVAFGSLADGAYRDWSPTQSSRAGELAYQHVTHPTQPISSSGGNATREATATTAMLEGWNAALMELRRGLHHPDTGGAFVAYGEALAPGNVVEIPERDLPPGLPSWMRSIESWATRTGPTTDEKRATITVQVPQDVRSW
jgi:hypothetical protein